MLMDIAISVFLVCFAGMMSGKYNFDFQLKETFRLWNLQFFIFFFFNNNNLYRKPGLTLGLLSLDPVVLRIAASSAEDPVKARRGLTFFFKNQMQRIIFDVLLTIRCWTQHDEYYRYCVANICYWSHCWLLMLALWKRNWDSFFNFFIFLYFFFDCLKTQFKTLIFFFKYIFQVLL